MIWFSGRVFAVVAGILSILAFAPVPARAQAPPTCSVGAFVTGLHDVDSAARTFKADFWLWSLCPEKDLEPLNTIDFVNGVEIKVSLERQSQRGGAWWSIRKVSGVFREDFELNSFPFDRHPLVIQMEKSQDTPVRLAADTAHSGLDAGIRVPGWRLKGFSMRSGEVAYSTSFGDPAVAGGQSRLAGVQLVIQAERAHLGVIMKLASVLYISAFLMLISLLFDVANTDLFIGRIGLQASVLFAVVLNWIAVGAAGGHNEGLTLIDQLHLATLALVLGTSIWSTFAYRSVANGVRAETVRRWDGRSAAIFLVVFVLVNAAIYAAAIRAGGANPILYAP